jgi:predicted DNA-binding transcriptional regulator YafY
MRENKRDRLARLSKVEHLLYQCPDGLTINAIAEKCDVCARTTRRDLEALAAIGVPMWEDKSRRGIVPGYFLPPISFTLPEAMTIFLAARLLLAYSNTYNPNIDSTFVKLNSAVPPPLRHQVTRTIDWMQKLNKDDRARRIMDTLAHAWINGRKVRILYLALGRQNAIDRVIEPYFIQPATFERANYVIAYCNHTRKMLTFKVDRIKDIELLEEHYSIPEDFDANKFLESAWGIAVYGKPVAIKLRFNAVIAQIVEETGWHPSQAVKMQRDGSAIVTFKVPVTDEFIAFVTRWGEKVEVLQPMSLRKEIKRIANRMMAIYDK